MGINNIESEQFGIHGENLGNEVVGALIRFLDEAAEDSEVNSPVTSTQIEAATYPADRIAENEPQTPDRATD